MELDCEVVISVRERDAKKVRQVFAGIYGIEIEKMS